MLFPIYAVISTLIGLGLYERLKMQLEKFPNTHLGVLFKYPLYYEGRRGTESEKTQLFIS